MLEELKLLNLQVVEHGLNIPTDPKITATRRALAWLKAKIAEQERGRKKGDCEACSSSVVKPKSNGTSSSSIPERSPDDATPFVTRRRPFQESVRCLSAPTQCLGGRILSAQAPWNPTIYQVDLIGVTFSGS